MATQVSVTLPKTSMMVGETQQPVATITVNEGGALLNQRAITWASSNTAVATVTASATSVFVKGVSPGTAQVRATVDGVTGSAPLTVEVPRLVLSVAQFDTILAVPVGGRLVLTDGTRSVDCVVQP